MIIRTYSEPTLHEALAHLDDHTLGFTINHRIRVNRYGRIIPLCIITITTEEY